MGGIVFEDLGDWGDTRETLQAYAKVVSAIPRAILPSHAKWWQISLRVDRIGVLTNFVPTPSQKNIQLGIDLIAHEVFFTLGGAKEASWPIAAGYTASELAEKLFKKIKIHGIDGDYEWETFGDSGSRAYNPYCAEKFHQLLTNIDYVFSEFCKSLEGAKGPIQLWPHGFDIAFEWFGKKPPQKSEKYYLDPEAPQISFGWAPGDETHRPPYFYSSPWPFNEKKLTSHSLVEGARWMTGSWFGSLFPYETVIGNPNGENLILAYAKSVFDLASPDLFGE